MTMPFRELKNSRREPRPLQFIGVAFFVESAKSSEPERLKQRMKFPASRPVRIAALIVAVAGCAGPSRSVAQPHGDSDSARTQFRWQMFRVRSIPPCILAFWLDPVDNLAPTALEHWPSGNWPEAWSRLDPIRKPEDLRAIAFTVRDTVRSDPTHALDNGYPNSPQATEGEAGTYELPEGIDRVVAIDPQNSLLVRGTPTALSELAIDLARLDQPVPSVTLQCQFVTLANSDFRDFGFEPAINAERTPGNDDSVSIPPLGTVDLSANIVTADFDKIVGTLESTGRARLIENSTVTALNNFQAHVGPVPATLVPELIPGNSEKFPRFYTLFPPVDAKLGLTTAPSLNRDGTVDLIVTPDFSFPPDLASIEVITPVTTGMPIKVSSLHDGAVVALTGLKTPVPRSRLPLMGDLPMIGKVFNFNESDYDQDLVIFLKVTIQNFPARD